MNTASTVQSNPKRSTLAQVVSSYTEDERILVLQGGGALGAYQGGVFDALSERYGDLTWVAGISIGAINAAIIAGNSTESRVAKLREFWELVSSSSVTSSYVQGFAARETVNEANATRSMLLGVPGFFTPRLLPAPFQLQGTMGAISFYDTTPLRHTLERLIDFDRINAGPMRLSVGAVNVRTGNFEYFDSEKQDIDVRHIMASGALPPGFAPVEIDGEHYWDGGLVSNTPLQYVLDQPSQRRRVVFQVDLFAATGVMPGTLAEVTEREKDIRFSSRTRLNTTNEMERHAMTQAVQRLLAKLPSSLRDDPDVMALSQLQTTGDVDVVHLIYRSKHYESQSKDYEFSRVSVREHWDVGHKDMLQTLNDARWIDRPQHTGTVQVFDLIGND